ncbi:VOC family protein [Xylanimonas sp. McL0601]|uniref:VOC family protein n=1 Tax=Xylanimonas sp. McL0601 TaxID=3414739 RepID=UPI003CEB9E24
MVSTTRIFSGFSVDDLDAALTFYRDTLGLDARSTEMGLELRVTGGEPIFVYPKGEAHSPATYTVLNLVVPDVDAAVAELKAAGVGLEHYPGLHQDPDGVARSTDPSQGPTIAWFCDPARNVLSLIQE